MPLEPFKTSASLSLGVELELQLINLANFDLTPASPDLLHLLKKQGFAGNYTPEITESMIEISTGIHTRYRELLAQLQQMQVGLLAAAKTLNIGICGGGTHPFQDWSKQKIFPKQRYTRASELYGYLAKQFTVFGQHVHVGCSSGDEALYLLHALGRYIPHFIALSASSPFVQGKDTLFNSSRLNFVFAFPFSGRPPFILRWQQFTEDYFAKMEHTGVIKSMKDFYWDIRPKPEYGTIELRVCDTPLSVERAAALAAYLQALCRYLVERSEPSPREDDYLVYNYNRFQACRFGLEGSLVHPQSYTTLSLREDILSTLQRVASYAQDLDSSNALVHLTRVVHEGSDAHYLRNQYAERGSTAGMVDAALARFAATVAI
jgi:carboxylate-amine ligase